MSPKALNPSHREGREREKECVCVCVCGVVYCVVLCVNRSVVSDSLRPARLLYPKNTGVGSHFPAH